MPLRFGRYWLDFHRPARIDDRITIISHFSSVVRARFHLCQRANCATALLVDATLELVSKAIRAAQPQLSEC